MRLTWLMNELDLLYRCEARFGVPARMAAAALIIDYLNSVLEVDEPSLPEWRTYQWPHGVIRYKD